MSRVEIEVTIEQLGHRQTRDGKRNAASLTRIPRITRLMALAIKFQDMVDRGEVRDYADLARLGYVTRARLTQIMNLLLLAPEIQEQILLPECSDTADAVMPCHRSGSFVRSPLLRTGQRSEHCCAEPRVYCDLLTPWHRICASCLCSEFVKMIPWACFVARENTN